MTSVPDSSQTSYYDSSYTYHSESSTENVKPAKKKKKTGLIILLFILGIFLILGITVGAIVITFVKNMFMPRSFINAIIDEDYDKVLSYFPDYMAEEQYGDDGEEIFEDLKDNFEYYCGDDIKINKYSVNLTKTRKGEDAEETNEYYEDIYDEYENADKFYYYDGNFTLWGDEDSIDYTFEAIVCKIDGKYYIFSIKWDKD